MASTQRDAQLDAIALVQAVGDGDQQAARAVLDLGDTRAIAIELASIVAKWIEQDFPGDLAEVLGIMRAAADRP
jgi:ribonuclease HII